MRKLLMVMLATAAMVFTAGTAFAAEADPGVISNIAFATAFSMTVAAIGCGYAQGIGVRAACEGTARNPEASGKMTVTMLIGLAMIESLAIYALVINLILLFANPFF